VWELEDIQRIQQQQQVNFVSHGDTNGQGPMSATSENSVAVSSTGTAERPNDAMLTWDMLIKKIVGAISELNQLAKRGEKKFYVQQSRVLIGTIKEMLMASDTLDTDSLVLQADRTLRNHHYQLLVVISHLVLSVKKAGAVWPEPDAVDKMRYQAGQVLLAVRHYVEYGMGIALPLKQDSLVIR
jgi:hypothetical protein